MSWSLFIKKRIDSKEWSARLALLRQLFAKHALRSRPASEAKTCACHSESADSTQDKLREQSQLVQVKKPETLLCAQNDHSCSPQPSKKYLSLLATTILLLFIVGSHYAQDRFPRPEFESQYQRPLTTTPSPQAHFFEIFDIFVLAGALGLASYFALKKRSRRGIFWLTVFSAAYFGFYRNGCVCAVGSLQNVSAALFYPGFLLPIGVIMFFVLPLIFALFFGRTFCAGVCPLGSMQDLVMLKTVKIPRWLSEVLSLTPYLYLGFAVLFAATGSAFIICRYDPFISIYRMTGDFSTMIYSLGFVGLSVFIGRPYCRFLCPYGVLLGWMSSLSKKHVTITPDTCVQCRLCEDACPFDYIDKPASGKIPEPRAQNRKRLAMYVFMLPLMILVGGYALSRLDFVFARLHPKVSLAEQIRQEERGAVPRTSLETQTFRTMGVPIETLLEQATEIEKRFHTGAWILGAFFGLVFGLRLIRLSLPQFRIDYEIDRTGCYSCARCFESCPNEQVRLQNVKNARFERSGKEYLLHVAESAN
ncbi:MAG: 4Fe-4S binding protein [Deferribacteres bacterium]|nr:4Fe-4S binding protein [Deferribacteres bacterium]